MSAPRVSQQVLDSKAYAALSKWLSGHTKTMGEAVDAFCQPVEDKFFQTQKSSDAEGMLWTTWQGVIGQAAATPHTSPQRQKLVDFVVSLTSRPTLSKGDSTCQIDNMTVWKDLPVLGWELREAWNLAASANSDPPSKEQWINVNAFAATLVTSLHARTHNKPDYSLFGLWTLRMALEEQGEIPDVSTAAAAVWLINSAPALRSFCKENKSFEGKVARAGSSFKEEEWRGFCEARWDAWRNNLRDVQRPVATEPVALLVEEAVKAMESAEKE